MATNKSDAFKIIKCEFREKWTKHDDQKIEQIMHEIHTTFVSVARISRASCLTLQTKSNSTSLLTKYYILNLSVTGVNCWTIFSIGQLFRGLYLSDINLQLISMFSIHSASNEINIFWKVIYSTYIPCWWMKSTHYFRKVASANDMFLSREVGCCWEKWNQWSSYPKTKAYLLHCHPFGL